MDRHGQSLTEVLIATAVTAILIIGAIALISPVLQNDRTVGKSRVSGALGQELVDNTRSFAEADWHNIFNLNTSSANRYYLSTSTSPFAIATGTEMITSGSTTYARYFYIDEVLRDTTSGAITTSTLNSRTDPATRRVTVVVVTPQGATSTLTQILTRSQNFISSQSDWSGGSGYAGPTSGASNQFSSSSNINSTTTPGSIQLNTL